MTSFAFPGRWPDVTRDSRGSLNIGATRAPNDKTRNCSPRLRRRHPVDFRMRPERPGALSRRPALIPGGQGHLKVGYDMGIGRARPWSSPPSQRLGWGLALPETRLWNAPVPEGLYVAIARRSGMIEDDGVSWWGVRYRNCLCQRASADSQGRRGRPSGIVEIVRVRWPCSTTFQPPRTLRRSVV